MKQTKKFKGLSAPARLIIKQDTSGRRERRAVGLTARERLIYRAGFINGAASLGKSVGVNLKEGCDILEKLLPLFDALPAAYVAESIRLEEEEAKEANR